jgi:uroporphyrinogen III methyltransferase/synthase
LVQSADALGRIGSWLPGVAFELVPCSSPGDRDRQTDLRASPADFFTRDLDEALLAGRLDLAIHSAKDLPEPMPDGVDWCWLPWREDPRDALILAPGRRVEDLPSAPVIGVSSERRETWCRKRFPDAVLRPVRGNIADRLAQLDAGTYDALLMAGAALVRLNLSERATAWLSLEELPVPAGQGVLAMTFRAGDPAMTALRDRMVKAVRFVGAGVGSDGLCTLAGAAELAAADVCLYDSLMDERLLHLLPTRAERVFVGKRSGNHAVTQDRISQMIAEYARRGLRVVRLKGGDPGLFGRLAEELQELDRWKLPCRIVPGVSSLNAATTGTGMLLTRRGVSRGFTVMTPRSEGGAMASVDAGARAALPLVFFMAGKVADQVAAQLLQDGRSADMPVAQVFNAGADDERVAQTTLGELARAPVGDAAGDAPSLLIVGEIVRHALKHDRGALAGRRVLLTCSEALQERAARRVTDFGGRPICRPLVRMAPCAEARPVLRSVAEFDAVILTSPSAVRCFIQGLADEQMDRRRLPGLVACGPGTAAELQQAGLFADVVPERDFGAEGLLASLRERGIGGRRLLRLRSDRAGDGLGAALRLLGAEVIDGVLYENRSVHYDTLPAFDAVCFSSASTVETFLNAWGAGALAGKLVTVIGQPTAAALRQAHREPDAIGGEATVDGAIEALASHCVQLRMKEDHEQLS